MRIALLGNSGSGKSTLAHQLAVRYDLAALDLDTCAWEPGQVAVPRDPAAALADVLAFCGRHERWVIESCYATLIDAALDHGPLLVFLEPGQATCLAHARQRPWEPHKYASKEDQDEKLAFLLTWIEAYYTRTDELSLSAHQALFDAYAGPKRQLTAPVPPADVEALVRLAG